MKIENIELNLSNKCPADCYCCSKHRGKQNIDFMDEVVFNKVLKQLKEIEFNRVHTSGCGEGLCNTQYIKFVTDLRNMFPKVIIDYYSNFFLLSPNKADKIIERNIINEIHISIDSIKQYVFDKATELRSDIVFDNIKYFLKKNTKIKVFINYRNIRKYWERCRDILKREPLNKKFDEINNLTNEYQDIQNYFNQYSKVKIEYSNTAFSLWGERDNCEVNNKECCPKINVIKNTIWIDPDGKVRLCPYDEEQGYFIYGNIKNKTIKEIWNSEQRKKLLQDLESGKLIGKYPCNNALLCCQQ